MADNTLGLQLGADDAQLQEEKKVEEQEPQVEAPGEAPFQEKPEGRPSKGKPYVNPDRVKTGGAQRDKLSEDALAERMAKMREQNEKIKQRRLAVEADEESYRKTQEEEKAKQAKQRKVQEDINRTREQVAKRKMERAHNREWDSEKPAIVGHARRAEKQAQSPPPNPSTSSGGWPETDPNEPPPTDWASEEVPAPTPASPVRTNEEAGNSSGQWTRGGGPGGGFRGVHRGRGEHRGWGRGRGGRGKGGGFGNPPITTQPEPNAES